MSDARRFERVTKRLLYGAVAVAMLLTQLLWQNAIVAHADSTNPWLSAPGQGVTPNSSRYSFHPSTTPDGRYVVFHSATNDFGPADSDNLYDIYRSNTVTGVKDRVSVDSNEQPFTDGSQPTYAKISANGRWVLWDRSVPGLGSFATVRDMQGGVTYTLPRAVTITQSAYPLAVANNGMVIINIYSARSVNPAWANSSSFFKWNPVTNDFTQIAAPVAPAGSNETWNLVSDRVGLSADGATLVASIGRVSTVTNRSVGSQLAIVDLNSGAAEVPFPDPGDSTTNQNAISPSGRYVAVTYGRYQSSPNQPLMNHSFWYDRQTGQLVDFTPTGGAAFVERGAVSDDGRTVYYRSSGFSKVDVQNLQHISLAAQTPLMIASEAGVGVFHAANGTVPGQFAHVNPNDVDIYFTGVPNIELTPPFISDLTWTNNPKPYNGTATVSVAATDVYPGVAGGEYYLGQTGVDPGEGNGIPMTWDGTRLSATFGGDMPSGHNIINIRARDLAGNWSSSIQTSLFVDLPDTEPPVVTAEPTTQPNADGWYSGDVLIMWSSTGGGGSGGQPAPVLATQEGEHTYYSGDVCDDAGNCTQGSITIKIDRSLPAIEYTLSAAPNAQDWINTDVTVSFVCTDALSGIVDCTDLVTLTAEGANQIVTGYATDAAGNSNSASVTLNIDKTAPVVGVQTWSANPKTVTGSTDLIVPVTDNLSGVQKAEYFVGDEDPGRGNGVAMALQNVQNDGRSASLVAALGTDFSTGVYKITVRAQDNADNWSEPVVDYLVVYDPAGPKMTGKRIVIPSLAAGDVLPGLIGSSQSDKAKFGFSIKYDSQGQVHHKSDFQFSYKTGSHCNSPNNAVNCHDMQLNATSIVWFTTQGVNNSTGIFQGTALMTVDGQTSTVTFRITGVDGERLSSTAPDQFQMMVYTEGADPNIATPLYRINVNDIERGNIKIQ